MQKTPLIFIFAGVIFVRLEMDDGKNHSCPSFSYLEEEEQLDWEPEEEEKEEKEDERTARRRRRAMADIDDSILDETDGEEEGGAVTRAAAAAAADSVASAAVDIPTPKPQEIEPAVTPLNNAKKPFTSDDITIEILNPEPLANPCGAKPVANPCGANKNPSNPCGEGALFGQPILTNENYEAAKSIRKSKMTNSTLIYH